MAPSIRDSGPDARRAERTLRSQRTRRARCGGQSRRYRLHPPQGTWTVVREPGQRSPRLLSTPAAVAELARDLIRAQDEAPWRRVTSRCSCSNRYPLKETNHMSDTLTLGEWHVLRCDANVEVVDQKNDRVAVVCGWGTAGRRCDGAALLGPGCPDRGRAGPGPEAPHGPCRYWRRDRPRQPV
jgi:hypothetical protein